MKTEHEAAVEKLKELAELSKGDAEGAHSDADAVLCSLLIMLGYRDVVDAWMKVTRWYA